MTDTKNRRTILGISVLFFSALVLRLFFALICQGFSSDISCFYCWALRAFEGGLPGFYSEEYFSDYPPGYIYILYFAGALLSLFKSSFLSPSSLIIIKLPAIICDLITGLLVYRYASKRNNSMAVLLAAFYLLDPAIIQNSSVWGQVDSVFTLALVLMCIFLTEKKTIPAYFAFAAGILIKPQTLIFSPLIILGIYENVFRGGVKKGKLVKELICGISAVGLMLAAFLPFGIEKVIQLYISTMSSYPYVSVNAYNFWSMLGLNWVPQDTSLIGPITYKMVGTAVILLICIFSAVVFLKRISSSDRYWVT